MDFHAAHVQRRQAELDELDAELKTLKLKVEIARPPQDVQIYSQLQDMRTQDELNEKLEAAWEELHDAVERIQQSVE
jgi:hypothetical protein